MKQIPLLAISLLLSGHGYAVTVTLSSNDLSAAETSSGTANTGTVTITRDGATTSALTVNLAIRGDASNGVDYALIAPNVTIAAGQTSSALSVTPIDDSQIEGAETVAIWAVSSGDYTAAPGNVAIVLNDNDNATPISTLGIVYASHNAGASVRDVKLNVYLPSVGSGPWPVLIYYPGGGWSSQTETSITALSTNLTAAGYAVVSANYVSTSFTKWPAQIQDAKAAVRWVRGNAATYGFDATRIAVTGISSGGHIASYVGVSGGMNRVKVGSQSYDLVGNVGGNFAQSDVVQAVAPFFGPSDLLVMDHYPTPGVSDHNSVNSPESGLFGLPIQTIPEKTATANPIVLIRNNMPPFFITQGTADALVDFNQSELLNAALLRAGQQSTFWPVQGGGHGPGVSDSQEVAKLLRTFLDRTFFGATSNQFPTASFTASALTGVAPLTVTFDASASSDNDGVITKYSWSNGDDTGASGTTMSYTYTHSGIFPVTLAVRDDHGASHSQTANVIVSPAGNLSATPPTISISGPITGAVYFPGNLILESNPAVTAPASIASVEFFINNAPIAWDTKPPFNTTLAGLAPGTYLASARVSDTTGAATTTPSLTFVVSACDLFCTGFE
jgi:acetyl esterase/lipase